MLHHRPEPAALRGLLHGPAGLADAEPRVAHLGAPPAPSLYIYIYI